MSRIARRASASAVILLFAVTPLAAQPASGGHWNCTKWSPNKKSPQGRECAQWSSGAVLLPGAKISPPPFAAQRVPMAQPVAVKAQPRESPAKREKHRRH